MYENQFRGAVCLVICDRGLEEAVLMHVELRELAARPDEGLLRLLLRPAGPPLPAHGVDTPRHRGELARVEVLDAEP